MASTDTTKNFKLGGRPPNPQRLAAALKFGNIRAKAFDAPSAVPVTSGASAVPATADALVAPPSIDYQARLSSWQVLGNDKYGNCNAVGWANTRRLVSSEIGRTEIYPNQAQVDEVYKWQNPGFPQEDNGMDIQTTLDYMIRPDVRVPGDFKPLAFALVDHRNMDEVKAAIATFGSLWLGIVVVNENHKEFRDRKPWTVKADSKYDQGGGHVVMAAGYDSQDQVQFVTWGGLATFSKQYWNGIPGSLPFHSMITQAWVVIWPEHMGTRRFWAGVDTQQLNQEYQQLFAHGPFQDGSGRQIDFPAAPFNSLWLIQSSNVANVTATRAPASNSYATIDRDWPTPVRSDDARNGTFCFENTDLYFIKKANTPARRIEVHSMIAAGAYQYFDLQCVSIFSEVDAGNGSFTIDNGDLYLIKTRNTGSGVVEVHAASHRDKFASYSYHGTTPFTYDDAANGYFILRGGDLYYIRCNNTASGKTELYISDGEKNYTNKRSYVTTFTSGPVGRENGTYGIGNDGNLYFVWSIRTIFGKPVVEILTRESGYQSMSYYTTPWTDDHTNLGTWVFG